MQNEDTGSMMMDSPNDVSWLHRFAAAVALAAFTSIVVGAVARSSAAAISTSQAMRDVPYESGYRAIVATVVVFAVLLAVWLWQSKSEGYLKLLGAIMAGVAIIHAVVPGGILILNGEPGVTAIHACLEYVLFSLALCLALFTRTDWRWGQAKTADVAAPSLRSLAALTTIIIFAESVLGAGLSSGSIGTPPHLWTGLVATGLALWVLEVALNKFSHVAALKIPAILLAEAVVLQLFIGLVAHSMALNARVSPQPLPGLAVINATHAAAAALALAASLFASFQAFKYLAPAASGAAIVGTERGEIEPETLAHPAEPFRIKSKRPLNPESNE
jgi:heme A synthase